MNMNKQGDISPNEEAVDFTKKRVRRGESFCRTGIDRTISNSLKSPSKQKARILINEPKKNVTFSEQTPLFWECSNFEPNMTQDEYEQRKDELWYSRNAFEDFLRERIATIRLLQMVHGDADAMRQRCPDLCMRGLEPFEANTLNHELQSQRQMHQRIVLAEQTLQKRSGTYFPERIRQLAEERSEWARQRARQLARMDELEIKLEGSSNSDRRRSISTGLQNLMIQQRPATAGAASTSLNLSSPLLNLSSRRRVPVDTAILKEWNAKFLADIRKRGGGDSAAAISGLPMPKTTTTMNALSLSDATAQSRMSLHQFGRSSSESRLGDTNNKLDYCSDSNNVSPDSTRNTADFRFPLRRDSLLALRRDSLLANNSHNNNGDGKDNNNSSSNTLRNPLNENCFRFPVRRDSLSNVHWTS